MTLIALCLEIWTLTIKKKGNRENSLCRDRNQHMEFCVVRDDQFRIAGSNFSSFDWFQFAIYWKPDKNRVIPTGPSFLKMSCWAPWFIKMFPNYTITPPLQIRTRTPSRYWWLLNWTGWTLNYLLLLPPNIHWDRYILMLARHSMNFAVRTLDTVPDARRLQQKITDDSRPGRIHYRCYHISGRAGATLSGKTQ